MKAVFRLKGNQFSGHRGHKGRPGLIGGSLPGSLFQTKLNVPGPTKVYHGTDVRITNRIVTEGLKRGDTWMGRKPSVYFAGSVEDTFKWIIYGDFPENGMVAVVEFEIPDEWDKEVIYDEAANYDMGMSTANRIERDISPKFIRGIRIYKYQNSWTGPKSELKAYILPSQWEGLNSEQTYAVISNVLNDIKSETNKSLDIYTPKMYYTIMPLDDIQV